MKFIKLKSKFNKHKHIYKFTELKQKYAVATLQTVLFPPCKKLSLKVKPI